MLWRNFERLIVIGEGIPYINPSTGQVVPRWRCHCTCGEIKDIVERNLLLGLTKSCGCLCKERTSESNTVHGLTNTRIYRIWVGMNKRCSNPNSVNFKNYGGRGIDVCPEWASTTVGGFENFYKDMGASYEDSLTIDRKDVNSGYSKNNCKWSTSSEQARNKRNLSKGTSQVFGVSEQTNRYIATFYREPKKQESKSFSKIRLGDELALFAASQYRELALLRIAAGVVTKPTVLINNLGKVSL